VADIEFRAPRTPAQRQDTGPGQQLCSHLGNGLVLAGWAKPKTGGENAEYMSTLTSSAETAEYIPNGIYAPPCGKAKVQGDNNGNGVADSDEVDVDVNVDVDAPHRHHNLPDGSLTGGFCRHHWWC
jgi:hypothetical protein